MAEALAHTPNQVFINTLTSVENRARTTFYEQSAGEHGHRQGTGMAGFKSVDKPSRKWAPASTCIPLGHELLCRRQGAQGPGVAVSLAHLIDISLQPYCHRRPVRPSTVQPVVHVVRTRLAEEVPLMFESRRAEVKQADELHVVRERIVPVTGNRNLSIAHDPFQSTWASSVPYFAQ